MKCPSACPTKGAYPRGNTAIFGKICQSLSNTLIPKGIYTKVNLFTLICRVNIESPEFTWKYTGAKAPDGLRLTVNIVHVSSP
jgi:hypothetical protein